MSLVRAVSFLCVLPFFLAAEICEDSSLAKISNAWNDENSQVFAVKSAACKIAKNKKGEEKVKCSIKFIDKIDGKTKKNVMKIMSEWATQTKITKKFKGVIVTTSDISEVKETISTEKKDWKYFKKVLKCRKQKNCLKTPEKLFKLKRPKKSKKSPHLITEIQISTTKAFIPGFHRIFWDIQEWNGTKIAVDSDSRFKVKNCEKGKKWTFKILDPKHRGIYYAHVGATDDLEKVAITKQKEADYIHSDNFETCKSKEMDFCSLETSLEMGGCNGGYCCINKVYDQTSCSCLESFIGQNCHHLARSTVPENLPVEQGSLQLKEWASTLFLLLFVVGFASGFFMLWKRKKNDRLRMERNLEIRRNTEQYAESQLSSSIILASNQSIAASQTQQLKDPLSSTSLASSRSESSLVPPCGRIFNQSMFQ